MSETAQNLKVTEHDEPQPMPLVNMKVPRLFAALFADWRESKYFTEYVSGAAVLAFLSMPQTEQLRWINAMDEAIRKTYDLPPQDSEGMLLMRGCPTLENEQWNEFVNDLRIGTVDPFEVADPADDDDDATRD